MGRKTTRILRVLLLTLWCPLAAELWLRVLDPVPMLPRYVGATDYGIRGNEGNRTYWHRTAEYKVRIRTNSRGIRADREIPYAKPRGRKRILLLGDSFGMGYGVDSNDMFTSRMSAYLKAERGIDAEVVNLSTSGYGNAEELIALQAEGLKYKPDLVLVAWHSTDYLDNVRSGLFVLEQGRLVRRAQTYLPAVGTRAFLFQFAAYRFLAENSNLYNFLRDWAGVKVKGILAAMRAGEVESRAKEVAADEAAAEQYRSALTVAILQRIKQVAAEAGAECLVLDIPVRQGRAAFKSVFPRDGVAVLGERSLVSPIARFEREGRGRKLYWERSHGHFTPLGCDLVGRALADRIVAEGFLD